MRTVRAKRAEVESRAIERVDEAGGIANEHPTVTSDLLADVRQSRVGHLIARHRARISEHLAPDRVRLEMRLQALTNRSAHRRLKEPRVIDQPDARIAPF